MQAALLPPAEIRLQDALARQGRFQAPLAAFWPLAPHAESGPRTGTATVEVVGQLDDSAARLQDFRAWLKADLRLAFRTPPASLQAVELNAFMGADPGDPAKTIQALVLNTRGWYQAPQQREAEERARVEALYRCSG